MKKITASATIFIALISCNEKTIPCQNFNYKFSATATYIDARENYTVGDTLIIVSEFPNILYDAQINKTIDYGHAIDMATSIVCFSIDSVNRTLVPAIESINVFANVGKVVEIKRGSNTIQNVIYSEISNFYKFKIGIIFKQKGKFKLTVTDAGSIGILGQNCTNASVYIRTTNAEKNLYIITNSNIPGVNLDQDAIDHNYCVRVL